AIIGTTTDPLTYTTQGTYTITWTFNDGNGNTTTATQKVIVKDTVAPVKPVLADVTGECSATATAPTTTDMCSGNAIIGTTTDPLTYTTQGTYTITWTFNDGNGNTTTATQKVIVKDNVAPVKPVLADVIGQCSATATAPTTTDVCSGNAILGTTTDPLTYTTQGTYTITWTFNDGNGNTTTATQKVIVKDTTKPIKPILADVTGQCSATATPPKTSDECAGTITGTTSTVFPITSQGTTVVTWTFDDGNGNIETANQNVIIDNTKPIKPILADVVGQCSATAIPPTTSDACAGTILGTTSDPLTYTAQGVYIITWTFNDGKGNNVTATQNVFVKDTVKPTITCAATVTVNVDAASCTTANANVTLGTPTTADNCGVKSVTNDAPSVFPIGNTSVTWTVTDNAGNTATCTQIVTVVDTINPTITCAAPVTVNVDAASCTTDKANVTLGLPTTADNCGVKSVTNDAPGVFPIGNTTVTWTVTDNAGNTATCTQIVTVVDNINPTITCAAPVTVNVDAASCTTDKANVTLGLPTTADNCGVKSVTNDAPGVFPIGNTSVTWTVTDNAGNTATCTQIVTVVDTINPTITCAAPVTVNVDAASCTTDKANVSLGLPTTADNCGVKSVTNDAPGVFPIGNTTVTWTVTDNAGNTATCTQIVTVVDSILPTITCAAPVTVNVDADSCTTAKANVTLGLPTTADNCGVKSVTNDAPGVFPIGNTIVTWTVTDNAGNTATCTQIVTVLDTINPTITCAAPVTVNVDAASCTTDKANVTLGLPTTADNCGVKSVTNDAPGVFPIGNTTVTWTVTDNAGNTATCTQIVTVVDSILPTITCAAPVTVNVDADSCTTAKANVTLGLPRTADNCGVKSVTNDAPGVFPIGNTTVTWTVTDNAGNTATCTQIVTVVDNIDPTITCAAPVKVNVDAASCTTDKANVTLGSPTTADNCGVKSVTNDAPSVFPIGNTTVTWTVTDNAGNTATCTQIVTVVDNINPTITCAAAVTVNVDAASCTTDKANVTLGLPTTADNCGVKSVTNDAPSVFPIGNTTVTWTVTDIAGNTATCTQIVTVVDNINPTITCAAPVTVNVDAASCTTDKANVTLGLPTTADNCGVKSVTNDAPGVFPIGNTTVTWTVTDNAGNTATCNQIVTVIGEIIANDDTGIQVNGLKGGISVNNVLINDILNCNEAKKEDVITTFISSTNIGVTLSGTAVVVAAGTPAGSYTLVYQICEILNPTNCDTATVTVSVTAPAIVANDDAGTPVNGANGGTAFTNVLVNDTLNGVPVLASQVATTFVSSSNAGITLSGTDVVVAAGTPAGSYTLVYQ
ncbi:beta strand repeat-containing protein, partial [Flavobacterium sp. CAN_S2]|uniref:beta strand repeat-containing protein n=1 Tax=Flavobacterium sp. CAN_S2 TaxID=2787726 RepID=UPI0018CA3585